MRNKFDTTQMRRHGVHTTVLSLATLIEKLKLRIRRRLHSRSLRKDLLLDPDNSVLPFPLLILMAHQLWTVRRPGESELRGRFFASGVGPISPAEKKEICPLLGITLRPDTLFERTWKSADESFLPPEPDFTSENGRRFWVYRLDQQLPV
jgi:hypothetical protein